MVAKRGLKGLTVAQTIFSPLDIGQMHYIILHNIVCIGNIHSIATAGKMGLVQLSFVTSELQPRFPRQR